MYMGELVIYLTSTGLSWTDLRKASRKGTKADQGKVKNEK